MKRANSLSLLLLLLFIVIHSSVRGNNPEEKDVINNKGMYLSGQLSTNGWGTDIRYIFNRSFTLKAGVERLNLKTKMDFSENGIDYDLDLDYKTGGLFLMADINYTRNLYITIGAAQNSLNPEMKGVAAKDFVYGDIVIPAEMIGDFTFTLSPSMKISPYAGLGFRGFLGAKQRLVCYLETGLYYLGPPNIDIEANGLLAPTADPNFGQNEIFEKQFLSKKFW